MSDPTESPAQPRRLLVVWHSRTGASRQMTEAALYGAEQAAETMGEAERLRLQVRSAQEATADDVLTADGYLFCGPENLAALSGAMKEFFDRCYYPALDRIAGRPYALLVAAGSDGAGAVRQAERICTGWRLQPAAPPLVIITRAQTPEAILAPKTVPEDDLKACAELGGTLAARLLL